MKSVFTYDRGAEDADVVDGTVVVVADDALDAVGHIHTIDDLAEDGVGTVEMGRAATVGDDVELAGTGQAAGIDGVAKTGGGYGAVDVAQGVAYLGLKLVGQVACAQRGAGLGMATVGVASLYHEVGDDTVEEERIVEVLCDQTQEVVAMAWRLVIECDADVALCRFQQHLGA